jgi:hypothetical protein
LTTNYLRLSGYPPFYAENDQEILQLTLVGKFRYYSPDWDDISDHGEFGSFPSMGGGFMEALSLFFIAHYEYIYISLSPFCIAGK